MTREEAIKMAKADLKCVERDTSGQDEMCNSHKCDECILNYERGNMGEQKEWLRLAIKALEQEPCEDAVSRKSVIAIIQNHWWNCRDIDKLVNDLPSVTPQEPNTWSLDDAREDFMHDVYNELNFLPTNEEANRIIDSFDRVTSSIEQECKWIPVTERLPEEDMDVLVTIVKCRHKVMYAKYDRQLQKFCVGNYIRSKYVTAWMPLPEPYKAESEEK